MKNILKRFIPAVLVLSVFASCEMDQFSPTNLTPGEATSTMQDAEAWRMGLYSTMRGAYTASEIFLSDIQAGLLLPTTQYGNYYGPTLRWEFENSDIDDQSALWADQYRVIKAANAVLENVPLLAQNIEPDAADEAELNQILGEAHLTRAIAYQRLAVFFCDRYDAVGAPAQLGLPLVERVDVDEKPARASLAETYRFIGRDLEAAEKLMTDASPAGYLHNSEMATNLLPTAAVTMMQARVNLDTCNYALAAQKADEVIALPGYSLLTTPEALQDMWLNDKGSELIFQLYQSKTERGANWNDLSGWWMAYRSKYKEEAFDIKYLPAVELLMLFDDSDIRFDATVKQAVTYAAYYGQGGKDFILYKYPGNPAYKTAVNQIYNTAKLFRLPEAYLIKAEALAQQNQLPESTAALNDLHHTARGGEEIDVPGTADELLALIANEWKVEYVGEGQAFPALKRLRQGVSYGGYATQGEFNGGAYPALDPLSVQPDNMRWTWEIPQNDLFANRQMERNWNIGN